MLTAGLTYISSYPCWSLNCKILVFSYDSSPAYVLKPNELAAFLESYNWGTYKGRSRYTELNRWGDTIKSDSFVSFVAHWR